MHPNPARPCAALLHDDAPDARRLEYEGL